MGLIARIRGMVSGGGTDEPEMAFECTICHSTFETSYQVCPECGAQSVEQVS